ncbi:C2H2 type zinc finger domain-containing protein, partial [Amylocarpus encephaloides]
MSLDGLLKPPTSPAYTIQPFRTEYLLNTHANVHSSNHPHYCPVKGCPRSEGGKGFKRKNKMFRHSLGHGNPGCFCPLCPDREYKFDRPNDLKRHVRGHHVDKDKDVTQLIEVLSSGQEVTRRGRRR